MSENRLVLGGLSEHLVTEMLTKTIKEVTRLEDRKRLLEVDIANARTAEATLREELEMRRHRTVQSNRERLGLPTRPPMLPRIDVVEKHLPDGSIEITFTPQKRTCGQCVNWERNLARSQKGWCNVLGVAQSEGSPSPSCTKFDPFPLPQTPSQEAVAVLDATPTSEVQEITGDDRR